MKIRCELLTDSEELLNSAELDFGAGEVNKAWVFWEIILRLFKKLPPEGIKQNAR